LPDSASWGKILWRKNMKCNKSGKGILILAMLLFGVIFVASASANDSQETLSKGADPKTLNFE
jgi:hypothetical protein